ncbi:uncharacterized protein LOC128040449 [Gossypium raimondii]|uniref:uncharacterized protein LOC128040449 n=1 Tax=Gossypium raimondii TaxID=29730 RepID=UPI00227C038B|nr:uncharacterized protein LOC128040449 [Gossypium raimondii]
MRVQDNKITFNILKAMKFPDPVESRTNKRQEEQLIEVLKKFKTVIGWTIANIKGIIPSICMHKIILEESEKVIIDEQSRINPIMKEIVRKEVIQWLDTEIIYPISDSSWVVMDDFFVFGDSCDICLSNLAKGRYCPRSQNVQNKDRSSQSKVDVIKKLPPPVTVKGIRSFLGHVGFHLRFIKDFSKISKPVCTLLEKDTIFDFNKACLETFKKLKNCATSVSIIVAPNWNSSFELMCDARDFALGTMMGQKRNKVQRKFVAESEITELLYHYHSSPSERHFRGSHIAAKILQVGFFWPTLFKDAYAYVKNYDRCQRTRSISRRNDMPLTNIHEVELFDVRGINFLGLFPLSYGNSNILVVMDYVSKWVEAEAYPTNDANVVTRFLHKHVFTRFGTPRAIISDECSHFVNKWLKWLFDKYDVKHKLVTAYHPQTNSLVELANHEIKGILENVVRPNRKDWSQKLDDALWAYRAAYKTLLGMTLYWLVFGKAYYLPLELESRAH